MPTTVNWSRAAIASALTVALGVTGVVAAFADDTVTITGELMVVEQNTPAGDVEGHMVVSADGTITMVELPDGQAEIESGSEVTLEVSPVSGDGAAEVVSVEAVADPVLATSAAHEIYAVTVNDATHAGVSIAEARSSAEDAITYWTQQAGTLLDGFSITDVQSLTLDDACTDYATLWTAASELYPGVSFGAETNHLLVYTPEDCTGYAYAGIATVSSLARGGYLQIALVHDQVIAHEFGHNFGLRHSNLTYLAGDGTLPEHEYFSIYSVMGLAVGSYGPTGLGAAFRTYLGVPGVADHTRVETITADTGTITQTLSATTTTTGTTALALDDTETGATYYVEYRAGTGQDAGAYYRVAGAKLYPLGIAANYATGIVVTEISPSGTLTTFGTDVDGRNIDTSYQPGDTYRHHDGTFTLTVNSTTTSSATVTITTNPEPIPDDEKIPSTTSIISTSTIVGNQVWYTGSVTASTTTPTGSLQYYIDGQAYSGARVLAGGKASVVFPATLEVGTHTIRAEYSGSTTVAPSSATATLTITAKPSSKTKVTSVTTATRGHTTMTVQVSSSQTPTGTVTVTYRGRTIGGTALVNSTARLALSPVLKPGRYPVTVTYSGSSKVQPSTLKMVITVK